MRTDFNLEEHKIRATRLMKSLRGPGGLTASRRFRILPVWADSTPEQILAQAKHKHALAVIAREAGFEDWVQLKISFDPARLFGPRTAVFLNLWFRNYEEARQALTTEPKWYLFPYRRQFVVCEAQLLEDQNIDTSDPDWERIGRDWVKPLDAAAHARLGLQLRRASFLPAPVLGERTRRGRQRVMLVS